MAPKNITHVYYSRWHLLSSRSINHRIFLAAIVIGSLTFGVKLASMVKDSIVAASFGTGDAIDAFFIAFLLPTYIINVVGGSFNAALIPIYIETREHDGPTAAQRRFWSVMIVS